MVDSSREPKRKALNLHCLLLWPLRRQQCPARAFCPDVVLHLPSFFLQLECVVDNASDSAGEASHGIDAPRAGVSNQTHPPSSGAGDGSRRIQIDQTLQRRSDHVLDARAHAGKQTRRIAKNIQARKQRRCGHDCASHVVLSEGTCDGVGALNKVGQVHRAQRQRHAINVDRRCRGRYSQVQQRTDFRHLDLAQKERVGV
mmetsp:Transcript_9365/g.38419  ORF Transcript_9365/g.38419 Transcript_9365/m.38419 type:complete len:200 (-) Transcript_9365:3222-3821(-)